jgi:hypothetical protein
MELTQELIKELFEYRDGFLYWKVDRVANKVKGEKAGYVNEKKTGARHVLTVNRKLYYLSRLIFLWHHGELPDVVDHEDRNKLNNRIENLRKATSIENGKNKTARKNSSSIYLGVTRRKARNSWEASIEVNGKGIYLGQFKKEYQAALAYNREAVRHHKEFANLNIIINY